jgi:hypothetical protein
MYERFTDRARKVMQIANQEAIARGSDFVCAEHILIGIAKERGVGHEVLNRAGISLASIVQVVDTIRKSFSGPGPIGGDGKRDLGVSAERTVNYAKVEAETLGQNYLGTEHLLLGLYRCGGWPQNWLAGKGLPYEKAVAEIKEPLGLPASEAKAEEKPAPEVKAATDAEIQAEIQAEMRRLVDSFGDHAAKRLNEMAGRDVVVKASMTVIVDNGKEEAAKMTADARSWQAVPPEQVDLQRQNEEIQAQLAAYRDKAIKAEAALASAIAEQKRDLSNLEYCRGLLIQCAKHIGPAAYTADDGSVWDTPLLAKVPLLVESLVANYKKPDNEMLDKAKHYRGLLAECANHLADVMDVGDGGSLSCEAILAKLPELVKRLVGDYKAIGDHVSGRGETMDVPRPMSKPWPAIFGLDEEMACVVGLESSIKQDGSWIAIKFANGERTAANRTLATLLAAIVASGAAKVTA